MNFKDSNFYLKEFKWITLLGLAFISFVLLFDILRGSKVLVLDTTFFVSKLYPLFFWLTIGRITSSYKNALIAFVITLCCSWAYLTFGSNSGFYSNRLSILEIVVGYFLGFIGSFVFGYLEFKNFKSALFIGVGIFLIGKGLSYASYQFGGLGIENYLLELIFRGLDIDFYRITSFQIGSGEKGYYHSYNIPFRLLASQIVSVVAFLELYRWIKNGQKETINDKILNFYNDYSKLTATTIFYSFKLSIYTFIGSIPFIVSTFTDTSSSNYAGDNLHIFRVLLIAMASIITLYFLFWYLRKFLTEFFLTYNRLPSWLYWLCLLPAIDILIWVYVLLVSKTKNSPKEKRGLLNESVDNDTILSLLIIGQIVFLFLQLFGLMGNQKLDAANFSSGFATANMIISIIMVYIMNRSYMGFQVFLGFHILSSFILFIASLGLANGFSTNYLLTVLVAFCLLPMFHLHEFWIIAPTPTEEVIDEEQNLE